jgi:hypothetical protein
MRGAHLADGAKSPRRNSHLPSHRTRSRYLRLCRLADRNCVTACCDFFSSSRHYVGLSTWSRYIPSTTTFRPQTFSVSRRFSPDPGFEGLFHPSTTCRIPFPSKDFSQCAASLARHKRLCPLAVSQALRHRSTCANFEALLRALVRSTCLGFSQARCRALPRVLALPGHHIHRRTGSLRPIHPWCCPLLNKSKTVLTFGVFSAAWLHRLRESMRACLSFRA